jgi:twitching motility protein PilT
MARLDSFLRLIVDQKASDLHFHSGREPLIRHNGDILPLNFRPLSESETRRFLLEILTPKQREQFEAEQEIDFLYDLAEIGRFRCNLFLKCGGLGAVFRVIPNRLPTIDELDLPPAVRQLCKMQNGLILVTGPTGSGKTTTLAAIVNEINQTSCKHIITIEDPIEFIHKPVKCAVTQRQVGRHIESFSDALRSCLRESPDVIVAGEMRDLETVQVALQAAETGVLVFGTLHTNSASKVADRIIDVFPDEGRDQVRGLVSVLLKAVIAQQLIKRASGDGRVAAIEVLLQTTGISNLIREGKTHQIDSLLQSMHPSSGMQSLDSCILKHIREGVVDLEDGMKVATFPDQLEQMCTQMPEEI